MAYIGEDNRAMLRSVHWDVPLNAVFDEALALGKLLPVEETDSLAIRWMVQDNDDKDKGVLEPGKWDIGTDFPEIRVSELGYDSTVIDGEGVMVKFDPKRLYYNDGALDIKDAQRRIIRKWAKKLDKGVFTDVTNARATAKGSQFDSVLTEMSGGIATGSQKHLIFATDSGKAWNEQGDAVQQIRELVTSIKSMNRLASLSGDVEFNPRTTTAFMTSLALGALHDQLRDADLTVQSVGTEAITVPSLYGMTFAVAEHAIADKGDVLLFDTAATPMKYYQSLPPLPGYTKVSFAGSQGGAQNKQEMQDPSASKLTLLVRDDDTKDGGVEVRMAHMGKTVVRKPKSVGYWSGVFA